MSKSSLELNKNSILSKLQGLMSNKTEKDHSILIAIPIKKFWENVNANEIKAIKENDEIMKKKEGILNLVSLKYGFENMELFHY